MQKTALPRLRVLWLVSWYPNKTDMFDGDFIQRHARAVAMYHDVHVLLVKSVPSPQKAEVVLHAEAGLTEQIIYVRQPAFALLKPLNFWQWQQAGRKAIQRYMADGPPAVVHVHVPWRAGLLALWLKRKYNINYGITEHWGIYNTVVTDNFSIRSGWQRRQVKRIFEKASFFISVSAFLAEGVRKYVAPVAYSLVPNVVDTRLFYYQPHSFERFTFIHVSNGAALKNVSGILQSFNTAFQGGESEVRLLIVGPNNERYQREAAGLPLAPAINFTGEVAYSEVARLMRQSACFVLDSDMENSPCVIGEALCCGLPVIATQVGGIPELVDETNGLLVPPRDNSRLSHAMIEIFGHYKTYNREEIAAAAAHLFSMEAVGSVIAQQYAATGLSAGAEQ